MKKPAADGRLQVCVIGAGLIGSSPALGWGQMGAANWKSRKEGALPDATSV